ncbi:MAG: IS256 family transposase [Candidatus Omnitrophota bacterium]
MRAVDWNVCPATRRHIVADWRRTVKENDVDSFWKAIERQRKESLKLMFEETMSEELKVYLGLEWNQKVQERIDYRNGYRYRDLLTPQGWLELKVPRLRKAGFKTKVFKNYRRRMAAVDRALKDIFLAGVSTRRVGEALSCLLDASISATTISNVTKSLDEMVRRYQNRKLLDEYQYLLLDGIVLKVKEGLKYHKKAVLVVYGITFLGIKELVAYRQVARECKTTWLVVLNDLYQRGLFGENLRLITIDGHKGLRAAVEEVYPFVAVQRCWAHKVRNVVSYLRKSLQKECSKEIARIYNAKSKQVAINEFKVWKSKWQRVSKAAVDCLEKDMTDLLRFFDRPKDHWKKVRTTNPIERSFREVRRRVKTMNCFSNAASCDRIMFAIFNHLNNHWKEHPLKDFNQLGETAEEELTHFS